MTIEPATTTASRAGHVPVEPTTREIGLMHRVYKPTLFRSVARRIPRSVPPNAITLAGQACAISAGVLAYAGSHGRPSLYPASALLHLAYLTSDNVDGMHARATGQVSRVGELLDHGLDGLAITSLALTVGFVLHVPGPLLAFFVGMATLGFLAAH